MPANIEYELISKILEEQDFHTIEKLKIDTSYFYSAEARQVFEYIRGHFHARATFGHVPNFNIVHSIFPGFPYTPTGNSIATLCDQVRVRKMHQDITNATQEIEAMAGVNPREALGMLRQFAATMANKHEVNDDMTMADAYETLLQNYHTVALGQGLTGLPWPWEILNEETQGIHKGEFIVLYGRPKSMKTWCGLFIAVSINMHANARVLIYSLEMPPIQIMRRAAALRTKVDYKKFKAGKLDTSEYQRAFQELANIKAEASGAGDHHNTFMVCGTSGDGGGGVSFLHSKIREFQPDLVLVDGMYLMKDDRQKTRTVDWKAIAHISQDLKRTAQEFNVPILGITQANRGATKNGKNADLSEIAYADSLAQDCDLAIRVHKQIDKDADRPELILALPGMREGDLDAFMIHGVPAQDFSFKSKKVEYKKEEEDEKKASSKKSDDQQTPQTFNKFGDPNKLRK